MKLIELSLADGRRIGLPPLSAVIIGETPPDGADAAKTVIRWHVMGGGPQLAEVKDSFRQVLNLFPKSSGGLGWTHATLADGSALAFPEGTIACYEEAKDKEGEFKITLGCATGPISLEVKATFNEIQAMLGNLPQPPRAPNAPRARKSRAK